MRPDALFPHSASKPYCKVCKMSIDNTEHMLHHILASPAHQWACAQIRTWIMENTQYTKPLNQQTLVSKKSEKWLLAHWLLCALFGAFGSRAGPCDDGSGSW
ncbi:hypothetical protein DPEC_G00277040 [Dallia pectoralis]|uniref:Uncharacterized protein n=1 Tax=Dallia pectoralis TaxID=75939 RepID=A0ACC2FLN6_DALPE|nr:hypothetical protein DPEC_G00277040 [Dallia pectoralis]